MEAKGVHRTRFEMDAEGREGAAAYLRERAVQALADGFRSAGPLEPLVDDKGTEWGLRGLSRGPEGVVHQSVYVYAPFRRQGRLVRWLRASAEPVVTIPDCDIERWLGERGFAFTVIGRATEWLEYRTIAAEYGDRRAARSDVLYMHHIDEGLAVLARIDATERARRAFCLHPLVQADVDLARNHARLGEVTTDARVLALAMEYRNIANATLSHRAIAGAADIPLSPLDEVNQMLVADKVQNRKDFLLHHRATHPRSVALDRYFALWLERLGVSEAQFEELSAALTP